MTTTLKCQFCNKPCNDSCCYLNRYAHIGCAERAFLMTPAGIRDEGYYERDSEERLKELNAATKPLYS